MIVIKDTKTELKEYNERGVELVHKLNFSDAIRVFTDAIKLDPKDFQIWNNIGVTFLFCGLFEEQRIHGENFSKLISLKSGSHITIVKNKNKDAWFNPAYEAFEKSLRLMRNAAALNNTGIWSFYVNWKDKTIGYEVLKLFEEAANLDKNNAAIWYNLGHARKVMGKYRNAEEALRKALALGETDERICCDLGNVLFNLGQNEEAVKAYKKALKKNPNFRDALSGLGGALYNLGDYAGAQDAFEKAKAITDEGPFDWMPVLLT